MRRVLVAAAASAALIAPQSPPALADGDPASDVLLVSDVFLPYPLPGVDAQSALRAAVGAVYTAGDRVKVAVIEAPTDLGSVPSLFGQPDDYARFLGAELRFLYRGPLLVAMPVGFGFFDHDRPTAAATATLRTVAVPGTDADGLTAAAAHAVSALERAGALHYKDVAPPVVRPHPQRVHAGATVKLEYAASDDSGRARIELSVADAHGTAVVSYHLPMRRLSQVALYTVTWRVPGTPRRGSFAFCGHGVDRAGNRGVTTCAKLTLS
jgi:hypothetical protein